MEGIHKVILFGRIRNYMTVAHTKVSQNRITLLVLWYQGLTEG